MNDNILDLQHVNVQFDTFDGLFSAVRNVSLSIGKEESIGIIGESGCGKHLSCESCAILAHTLRRGKIFSRARTLAKV
jgi:ABC-type dipeptide/oligopeptide/nickel transport system ATPase component